MKRLASFILLVLAVACCSENVSNETSSGVVATSLSDTSSTYFKILESYVPDNRFGSIAIIGDGTAVGNMRDFFLKCDLVDNCKGTSAPDGLTDFSGERIYAFQADTSQLSSTSFYTKVALCALDSLLWANHFEISTDLRKTPAKAVVFVNGAEAAEFSEIVASKGLNIILVDYLSAASKYVAMRHSATSEYALWRPSCASSEPDSLFMDLMAQIRERSVSKPYSAIVVDSENPESVISAVSKALEKINLNDTEENVRTRRLFAPDFEFIDGRYAVAFDCYTGLRKSNKLTMKIEYPEGRTFRISVNDDRIYVLK